MKILENSAYHTVVHLADQNWISKTVYFIRCLMVCKISFTNWNAKIALLRASMDVTFYIKLFWTGPNRYNGILMTLLLLVAEAKVLRNKKFEESWKRKGTFRNQARSSDEAFSRIYLTAYYYHRCSTCLYIDLCKFWNFQSGANMEQIITIVTMCSVSC